jgi:Uncharacterized protein involved in tolerance to divalent cations
MTTSALVVLCTCPNHGVATLLANQLIAARLAACVNLVNPVQSIYLWQGKVEQSEEVQMIIKTRAELFESLRQFIRSHHPYQAPEIIGLPIVVADEEYLSWIEEVTP